MTKRKECGPLVAYFKPLIEGTIRNHGHFVTIFPITLSLKLGNFCDARQKC